MATNFLNLTPHKVVLRLASGDIEVPPSGKTARVSTNDVSAEFHGVPAVRREFGELECPVPDGWTGPILVSALALEAAKATKHPLLPRLAAPDTGPTAVRDDKGQVVAVTRLVCT